MKILSLRYIISLVLLAAIDQCQGQPCPISCSCSTYRTMCQGSSVSLKNIAENLTSYTTQLSVFNYMNDLRESDFENIATTQLSELTISNGGVRNIYDKTFATMRYLKTLQLNDNKIASIAGNAFIGLGQLKDLDLSRNQLQYLPSAETFQPLVGLVKLSLSDNKLAVLPNGIFSTQTVLHELDISGNNLRNLRGSSFQGASNLRILHASRCGLRTLESDIFSKLSAIETLDLSDNELTNIPSDGNMHLLSNLRNLTLQGNRLTMLTERQFQGLRLSALDVSRNLLSQIDVMAFAFLGSVRDLDLSSNLLNSIQESTFKDIASQLYSLKLSGNVGLITLPINIFQGMVSLQVLDISKCGIEVIPDNLFDGVFSLRTIDLSNNKLGYLPTVLISRANSLNVLKIDGNPWHCDCNIEPLKNWLQNPMSFTKLGCKTSMGGFQTNCPKPVCATPTSVQGRDIALLHDQDIAKCLAESRSSPPVDIIAGVIVGVLVVIGLIVLASVCCYRKHKRGELLLCVDNEPSEVPIRKVKKREPNKKDYYRETKEKRKLDADIGSLNESDKSFVVRNYFHSMIPDPDELTQGTQSMTRKGSQDSMSQSGYEYGSRHGSRHSSQYSLNDGCKFESAV